MLLGRVVGCVWSTVKHPGLSAHRLVLVQPITPERKDSGRRVLCTDWTGAGTGETVYWCRGREASFAFSPDEVPTDLCIVGIVDSIHTAGKEFKC
ncbi:MAG TPA: EutN/CcmL family microcompartment protein [Bryobacteraceae bacterium]|nr:EutN/CcmL family microcompartment protein [Bryobacteraceae bacterium]